MNTKKILSVVLLFGFHCFGQGFVNLNFESATISNHAEIGSYAYTAIVSGWTYGQNYNYVNGNPDSIPYNNTALDAAAVNLEGTNNLFGPSAIQGKYSIFVQGGSQFAYTTNGASIMQTGQIPATAQSIFYWGGALQVFFNGQTLAFNAISNKPNYTVWAADISAYAGQVGQLSFTALWQTSGLLDNIQFSSTPVPEPSNLALVALTLALFGFCQRKLVA